MEKNLYKEAILDAKAVRASAIANAKATLQESIEPKIQEMMRLKLSEELEEDLEENLEEEGTYEEGMQEEGATIDEASLDEILAELDAMEEGKDKDHVEENESLEEDDDVYEEAKKKDDEEKDAEEGEEEDEDAGPEGDVPDEAPEGEEVSDDTKVIDVTLGDLKQVLQSVMGAQTDMDATGDLEADVPMDMKGDEEGAEDAAISLDEILAELENEGYGHDEKSSSMEEAKDEDMKDEAKNLDEVEKELEEAKDTIATLRESMKEINLLNAKLLYMNKIFKAKSLSESQKIKVIKAFDRSSSVNEVKNTYETLKESLGAKKDTIKESVGFASKPAGNAPKTPIVESNDFVSRWQKIAGIK